MATLPTHPLPLNRHDSATHLTNIIKPQAPQALTISFPCACHGKSSKPRTISRPPSPPSQSPKQDRLQIALLYLARAAAQLPPPSAAIKSLYEFAAPNWSVERWDVEVERRRAAVAAVRGGLRGVDRELTCGNMRGGAGYWVRRAVGVLKREGEEGEYWRDGTDLEVLWRRIGGECV